MFTVGDRFTLKDGEIAGTLEAGKHYYAMRVEDKAVELVVNGGETCWIDPYNYNYIFIHTSLPDKVQYMGGYDAKQDGDIASTDDLFIEGNLYTVKCVDVDLECAHVKLYTESCEWWMQLDTFYMHFKNILRTIEVY